MKKVQKKQQIKDGRKWSNFIYMWNVKKTFQFSTIEELCKLMLKGHMLICCLCSYGQALWVTFLLFHLHTPTTSICTYIQCTLTIYHNFWYSNTYFSPQFYMGNFLRTKYFLLVYNTHFFLWIIENRAIMSVVYFFVVTYWIN